MSDSTYAATLARARELAEYIDSKARGLDDFGDLAAIPTQPWCELLAVLGATTNPEETP